MPASQRRPGRPIIRNACRIAALIALAGCAAPEPPTRSVDAVYRGGGGGGGTPTTLVTGEPLERIDPAFASAKTTLTPTDASRIAAGTLSTGTRTSSSQTIGVASGGGGGTTVRAGSATAGAAGAARGQARGADIPSARVILPEPITPADLNRLQSTDTTPDELLRRRARDAAAATRRARAEKGRARAAARPIARTSSTVQEIQAENEVRLRARAGIQRRDRSVVTRRTTLPTLTD
ncbi:MAG: hypothetical protein AAF899_12750 [Pseudomonadota bacterium]